MIIKVDQKTCVVLDLDDTLYLEIRYLESAFKYIAELYFGKNSESIYTEMLSIFRNKGDVFKMLTSKYVELGMTVESLVSQYRNHIPEIRLQDGAIEFLRSIKNKGCKLGIISDGRTITQRNKIKSLGIEHYFDDIIISEEFGSEKPALQNYTYYTKKYDDHIFYYIGDNIKKDFITPKKIGWNCICISNGEEGIHNHNYSDFTQEYFPHFSIKTFKEIKII